MKSQILFSGKSKKNVTDLSSGELAQKVITINHGKCVSVPTLVEWVNFK